MKNNINNLLIFLITIVLLCAGIMILILGKNNESQLMEINFLKAQYEELYEKYEKQEDQLNILNNQYLLEKTELQIKNTALTEEKNNLQNTIIQMQKDYEELKKELR